MTDKEKQKHIDAFKYWCETNEECGVITIPKFVCDNIIKILDNAPTISLEIEKKEKEEDKVIICRPEGMGDDSSLDRILHPDDKYGFC